MITVSFVKYVIVGKEGRMRRGEERERERERERENLPLEVSRRVLMIFAAKFCPVFLWTAFFTTLNAPLSNQSRASHIHTHTHTHTHIERSLADFSGNEKEFPRHSQTHNVYA